MGKKKIIVACAMAVLASGAFAQKLEPKNLANVAQLSAHGSVEVQQDRLFISMRTSRDGSDASTVQAQLRQALDTALTQARKAAQPGLMEVRTGDFSLYPRYGKDGKINGWQGATELVLEGNDFSRITTTAGKIQSLSLNQVGFSLSPEARAKVQGEAQTLAIERFKARASDIAKGFGFASYSLREVSVNANDQGYTPSPRMMGVSANAKMKDSAIPVEAGKTTVQVNVSGSVQMK
ncbi:hypothetical protein AwPolaro_01770 [Polaromonas sp.]|nr:hypothetical protein AwPolaro_01770 [Polaromonas sp.]